MGVPISRELTAGDTRCTDGASVASLLVIIGGGYVQRGRRAFPESPAVIANQ